MYVCVSLSLSLFLSFFFFLSLFVCLGGFLLRTSPLLAHFLFFFFFFFGKKATPSALCACLPSLTFRFVFSLTFKNKFFMINRKY